MAAPVIKIKRSSVPGKIPTTASLPLGELALNTNDGKVYIQQDSVGIGSTVIVVNPWSVGLGSNTYNTFFTAGSVGIGTTTPTSSLHVVGNGKFTGIVTASSFSGDGSALTGIAITQLSFNNTSVSVASTNGAINFVSNNVLVATMSSERIFSFVPIDLGNNKITNLATPTSLADAANKDYVDNNVAGEFPVGDYGDLSTGTNDAFGVNTSGNETFDCLITPSGTLATKDLGVLT